MLGAKAKAKAKPLLGKRKPKPGGKRKPKPGVRPPVAARPKAGVQTVTATAAAVTAAHASSAVESVGALSAKDVAELDALIEKFDLELKDISSLLAAI